MQKASLMLSASMLLFTYLYLHLSLSSCIPLYLSILMSIYLSSYLIFPLCVHLTIHLSPGLPDEAVELSELRLLNLKNNRIASLQCTFFQSWVKVSMAIFLFISSWILWNFFLMKMNKITLRNNPTLFSHGP